MAQKLSPKAAQTHARRMKALQLRAARLTYQQIADRLYNGDKGNCFRDIQKAIDNQEKEAVAEVRAQEILLLDELARPMIKKALEFADDKAVTAVLRIMERRSKLLGLDAPTQIEQTGTGGFAIMVNPDLLPDGAELGPSEDAIEADDEGTVPAAQEEEATP